MWKNNYIPTECTEYTSAEKKLPRNAEYIEPSAEKKLPQIPLSTDANFRGCTCLKCTNRAILIHLLLRVRLYDMYCCLLRRLSPPLRMGAHPNNLCRSVKSVGEYHSKKVL